MPDFSEFADEAKNLAGEHPDIADKVVEEAGQVADDKTGGRFDSQIQEGEQKVEGYLGVQDQDAQGNQDSGQGN